MKLIINLTDKDITGSDKLSSAPPRIADIAALTEAIAWIHLHDIPR